MTAVIHSRNDKAEEDGSGGGDAVDAEIIWGQVDLQNVALFPRLKKIVRRLEKGVEKEEESGGDGYLHLLDR